MTDIPASPAPATPNREPMMATPAVVPKAAAPAPPIMADAPAATRGAASPPVKPVDKITCYKTISNLVYFE